MGPPSIPSIIYPPSITLPQAAWPWFRLQRTVSPDPVAEVAQEVGRLVGYLKRLAPDAETVLDYGCGVGLVAAGLAQAGYVVTAVDTEERTVTPQYGYRRRSDGYTDLALVTEVARANGVEVEVGSRVPGRRFDVALSTYAMGFHWPFDARVADTALWVVDIRDGVEMPPGAVELERGAKHRRVALLF